MGPITQDGKEYLKIIGNMYPENRLRKCFELNELIKQWVWTILNSRSESLEGFESIDWGTPILPISWIVAALLISSIFCLSNFNSLAIATDSLATLAWWPDVYGSYKTVSALLAHSK